MNKTRLEVFSDGVLAIPGVVMGTALAAGMIVAVALMWLIPDRRIEKVIAE